MSEPVKDTVRDKSTFLCMYMSNHPDTLVSYVRHYSDVKEKVDSAKMTRIDSWGMNLSYKTKGGASKEVRVPFDPALSGYDEVKSRLLQMKVDAEEALGMMKAPQILSFRFPLDAWKSTLIVGAVIYVTLAPPSTSPAYGLFWVPAVAIRSALPSWWIKFSWYSLAVVHVFEVLYTYSLCRKHQTPFVPTVLYLLTTLFWGFPVWQDFRARVQEARIDSIMKGQ